MPHDEHVLGQGVLRHLPRAEAPLLVTADLAALGPAAADLEDHRGACSGGVRRVKVTLRSDRLSRLRQPMSFQVRRVFSPGQ